jgi:methionine synthase II (cobalamin-independent)
MTGRALAVMADLGADLQPAGWRLTDAAGVDHRRARSLMAQDLDTFEELTQGYEGPLKVQVAGPWTLASTVEKPRGDRVLSDFGARRELAQALAEGVREHLADVQRRVSGAQLMIQVDEPALPSVLAGQVPTASGFSRHRSVTPPLASESLEWVFAAAGETATLAHCCAAEPPIALFRGAGARGVSFDLALLAAGAYDDLATALDEGDRVHLGVVPSAGETAPSTKSIVERVQRLLDMLGFDPAEVADQLVLTPACGLAGASPSYAKAALRALREAAAELG